MNGVWALSDEDLKSGLVRVFVEEQALAARRLALVREMDGRDVARHDGATSLVAWLRERLHISGGMADGGPTNLANAVLVCGYHHRLPHHHDWQVHIAADGTPEFTPPKWVDPQQHPRRNTYHRRL